MALTPYSADPNVITGLPTYPSAEGITAAQIKAHFDQDNVAFKAYFNSVHLPEVDSIKSTLGTIGQDVDAFDMTNMVEGETNKIYTATERAKLGGIAENANNYAHPLTHSADIIADGVTNKAYTATEKTKLAGIEVGATADMTGAELRSALGVPALSGTNTGDQIIANSLTETVVGKALDATQGKVLSETISELLHPPIIPIATSKTFILSDAGTIQNATATVTFTVPPKSSVAFPISTQISIVSLVVEDVIVVAGDGVTIRSKEGNLKIDGQYAAATLMKIAADEWLLVGALKA